MHERPLGWRALHQQLPNWQHPERPAQTCQQGDRTRQLYKTLSTQQECRKQMRRRVEKGVQRYLQRSFRMRTLLGHSSRRLWLGAGAHKCALQHAKGGQGGQQHKESRRTSRTKQCHFWAGRNFHGQTAGPQYTSYNNKLELLGTTYLTYRYQ